MSVFDALAQQFMQRPIQERELALQQKALQQRAQQQQQAMMMQQQQQAQEQKRYDAEVKRQARMDELNVRDKFTSSLLKAETPEGVRAIAAAHNGLLPPEAILTAVDAANGFIQKKKDEKAEERGITAYNAGLTSTPPPPQVIPPSPQMQAAGGMMQAAPFIPGSGIGQAMQAPQVVPPQSVLTMGGQPYYQRPKAPSFMSVGNGAVFDPNTRQFLQPPGGQQDPSGELGQLVQAQRLMGVDNPQQAAAELYSSQRGDSMFGIARRAMTQFKDPKLASEYLQKQQPMVMGYLKSIADGDVPISGFGEKQNEVRALVSRVVPGFDFTKFHSKQKMMDSVTDVNSAWNKNVLSLNTLASHLGELDKRVDELKASNVPAENAFAFFVRDVLEGDPDITGADITKEAVINEVERALSGVGATQQGIERVSSIIRKRGIGYEQLKEVSRAFGGLMDKRLGAIEQQYESRMGKKASPGLIRFPDAQASLDSILNHGSTAETSSSGAPAVGTIEDGHRFKGGNPADPNSWEAVE